MRRFFNKRVKCTIIAGVLVVSMLASYGAVASRQSSANDDKKAKTESAVDRLKAKRNETLSITNKKDDESDNEVVRAIITLNGKSVADSNNISSYNSKLKSKENSIIDKQESVVKKVEKLTGNKVVNQSGYLVNSFSIDATRKQMKKIAKLDGVKKVSEARKYTSTMATAVVEGNAKTEWEAKKYGYTGEGVVVAVIDTGVNYKHKDMVLDEGVKNKYSKKEWEKKIKLLGYGDYFTEKVPFGYDYSAGKNNTLSSLSPHGYHVSGIVAANGEVVGVAKNAQIVGLKVLNDYGYGFSDDIVKGIEDAVKLGVDVINMSLGYDRAVVSDDDFEQVAIDKASKEGIICCIAAGNSGTSTSEIGNNTNELNMKDTTTVGTPVIDSSSLGVASADNVKARTISTGTFKINDENITVEFMDPFGYGFNIENAKLVNAGLGVDENGKVTFKAKKIKDNVAIVSMGNSTLNDKLYQLSKAGAKGIIVVNKDNEINSATNIPDWYGIPTIVVNETDGNKLVEATSNNSMFNDTTFSLVSVANSKVTSSAICMSYFSSWGPTNELGIKPEITAPGGNIKSIVDGTDKYAIYSGTSMATPFVAGSEAVMINALRARDLKFKGEELSKFLKNSLINTADVIIDPESKYPYSVRYQGAGMVDVYGAVDNNVTATCNGEAKVELGELKGSKNIKITLTNYGKKAVKYNLKEAQIYTDNTVNNNLGKENAEKIHNILPVEGAKITFNAKEITVKAGSKATVTATVNIPSTYNKNSYVEAFITFEGNKVQNIGMPVLGFYGDWNAELIIDTPIYNGESSVIEKASIGAKSATALIETGEECGTTVLGQDLQKKQDVDNGEKEVNTDSEKDSRIKSIAAQYGFYGKNIIDTSNAIKVKVGDIKELAIVNPGDYVVYKVSSLVKTGCRVEFDNNEIYEIALYDKDLNFLANNFDYFAGLTETINFSTRINSPYYMVVKNPSNEIGLCNVSFNNIKYSERTDYAKILKNQKKYSKLVKLKENKINKLKYEFDECGKFAAKKDGYYTFALEKLGKFRMSLYEYKFDEEGSLIYGDEIIYEEGYKSISKEVKLYKDSVYVLKVDDLNRFDTSDTSAKVKITNTDGSNAYTLEKIYDENKAAFSPNGDDVRDCIGAEISQIRNAKEISVKVLNKKKEVIRTLYKGVDEGKQRYGEWLFNNGKMLGNYSIANWDGLIYNQKKGDYTLAKDGQYYIQIESKLSKKSLPQIVTMPVKIDTVAPELSKFDVSKVENDTIVTFNIKDNVGLSPYYYLDIEEKVIEDDEEYKTHISLAKSYVETEVNSNGDYVVNLGSIGEGKITMLLEDQAGNQITKAVNYDPSSEEEIDVDIDDEYDDFFDDFEDEEEDIIYELCEGACLFTKLEDGVVINALDDEIFIKGECVKGTQVEVAGYKTIYDDMEICYGEPTHYEDSEYFYIHIPVTNDVTTYSLPLSVKRDGKELYNKTYKVSIDIDKPTVTLLENSLIDKSEKYNNGGYEIILLKKLNSDKFTFKVQVNDKNLDDESFRIDEYLENLSDDFDGEFDGCSEAEYTYEGNGIYSITMTLLHCNNVVDIYAKDLSGKEVSKRLCIFMAEDSNLYNEKLDEYKFGISLFDLDFGENVLEKDMLNKDGTYTIQGCTEAVPDKLEINGKRVEVNPVTREFIHKIKINKGITKVNIDITVDGKTVSSSYTYYYDEIKVKYNNLPKANAKGVITTDKQIFNLSGVISSYVSVADIEINGDCVYSSLNCLSSVDGRVFTKDFDYKIKLSKGKNIIKLRIMTGYGHGTSKTLTVEYK